MLACPVCVSFGSASLAWLPVQTTGLKSDGEITAVIARDSTETTLGRSLRNTGGIQLLLCLLPDNLSINRAEQCLVLCALSPFIHQVSPLCAVISKLVGKKQHHRRKRIDVPITDVTRNFESSMPVTVCYSLKAKLYLAYNSAPLTQMQPESNLLWRLVLSPPLM